ncbi:hypothetical protein O181_125256 [Austropuccinia psidii MF-1]|uniref:Uncharacterized protein n=1 Tax=Austropuccinia psidii MF-1 TaxID=1389203 RepID=A0A9Q3KS05_9BASI|nr:hypothetical protein [Austropuccinia psidii MF-1]
MEDSFTYAKDKWDKSHFTPEFKLGGDLVLLSTSIFNEIKGCKKFKYSFEGPFVIKAPRGENSVQVELSEELSNKHTKFPVIFIKTYKTVYADRFTLRHEAPQLVPPVETSGTKIITKVLKEAKLSTKKLMEYLVRYSDPTCGD